MEGLLKMVEIFIKNKISPGNLYIKFIFIWKILLWMSTDTLYLLILFLKCFYTLSIKFFIKLLFYSSCIHSFYSFVY